MVRTPTVLQMENTECGAASLSIVLQHYGRYVPLTQLRELCGVSRDGTDAANLVLAARSFGLDAKGFQKGLDALEQLKPPAILFWEFNHFLVFEGFRGKSVALNDPALGPRTVSREDFDRSYTGIVLTMEPGPGFQRGGRAPSVWPIVLRRMASEPMGVAFILLAGLLLILPQLVMPVFAQIYLDEVIGNAMGNWLKPMLWAMALTIALQVMLQHLQLVGTRSLEKRLTRRFATGFEHHILSLPEKFYSQRHASDIAGRMGINISIAEFIGGRLIPMLTGLVLLVFYLILTFLYSPWLGLLILATTGINALVVQWNLRTQKDASLTLQKDAAKSDAVVVSAMRDIETIKAAAIEHDIFRRFAGYQSRLLNTLQEFQLRNARLRLIPNALTTFNEVAVLLLGFFLVIRGDLTLGMLLAAQTIAFSLKGQIEAAISFVQQLQGFSAGVLRLEDVLEQPLDALVASNRDPEKGSGPVRLSGRIDIKDLRYSFSAIQAPLINGLSLSIHPGMRVALVGGSGSGKSTMAKLLAGIYQPTGGSIQFDGRTLLEHPRAVVVSSLAMVQQEIQLFGCSVRDNLSLWNPAIDEATLLEACREAEIIDVVHGLPEGLDTPLNEGGRNLSGGQRQRLELARALVCNPSILILDEATSALDAETERKLIANLTRRGCTQVIVAHRLSTIRDADLILVMDQGKVIQQGTHETLSQDLTGPYAQLISEII